MRRRRAATRGTGKIRRLGRPERERQIADGAIRFFAERGFEGTRALATRLGITQPLLYRYFPTKQDLVERVYHELFLRRWDPAWEALLADRTPLGDRLREIYRSYARVIFNYEWVRIFMFAGLKGVSINRRYLRIVRERLFVPRPSASRSQSASSRRAGDCTAASTTWRSASGSTTCPSRATSTLSSTTASTCFCAARPR